MEHFFMIPVYLFQTAAITIAASVAILMILLCLRMIKKSGKKLIKS